MLWGRLGTLLPDSLTRRDGTRYASGTVWEYEEAVDSDKPVFVYRRSAKPQIVIDDPELRSGDSRGLPAEAGSHEVGRKVAPPSPRTREPRTATYNEYPFRYSRVRN